MSILDWSTVADTNQTADAEINWREGQPPSSVNNSSRAMMAVLASHIADLGGVAVGIDSQDNWSFTLSRQPASPKPYLFSFYAPADNVGEVMVRWTTDATLRTLRRQTTAALTQGQLKAGQLYVAVYNIHTDTMLLLNDASDYQSKMDKVGGTFTGAICVQAGAGSASGSYALGNAGASINFNGTDFTVIGASSALFTFNIGYNGVAYPVWHAGNFNPNGYAALNANVGFGTITASGGVIAQGDVAATGNFYMKGSTTRLYMDPTNVRSLYRNPSDDYYTFVGGAGVKGPDGFAMWSKGMHGQPVEQIRNIDAGGTSSTPQDGTKATMFDGAYANAFSMVATSSFTVYGRYLQYYRQDVGWVTMAKA